MTVLFLSNDCGFPNGFAGVQRMRLVARALTEAGVRVNVLLTRATERSPFIANTAAEGDWHDIHFKYSTGTPVRSDSFVIRRWTELRGIVVAVADIIYGRFAGDIDCVYISMSERKLVPFRMLRGLCASLGVPVVLELNEPSAAVWAGAPLTDGAGERDSLLSNVAGFVAISDGLEKWVRSRKGGDRPRIVRVPVLIDRDEVEPAFGPAARNDVFYAAAPTYVDEIEFVLDVVDAARESLPDLRVVFSGWGIGEVARPGVRERLREQVAAGTAVVVGAIPREQLLEAYSRSAALLLPMKDEPRSFARCPTKLGEYLGSGRPVIATGIGELGLLLTDGETAFLAQPGSVRSFADALVRALADPARAEAVGRAGRAFAEGHLDYRLYSKPLRDFFEAVCAGAGR